ncbi:hypothetical protein MKX41_21395 [Paenibacillus sp. FSL R5-0475]|uniref:hypothetical protein n=1 Tax=Paenibacillus sp. FSL R5-0475 TaxID=2921643 RepID=UPI0030F638C6
MQTTGNLGLKKPEGTDIVDIADLNGNMDILDNAVNGKVDKVTGKQLSTNDYTAAEKTKLAGVATGANNYLHPNHTGDVTSTGDGVTAIAAGVIVNADVNAAAGIDASKIGTGVVSNAEFGYLDGVTSGIQWQLNNKLPAGGGTMIGDISMDPLYINANSPSRLIRFSFRNTLNVLKEKLFGVNAAGQLNLTVPGEGEYIVPLATSADITYYVRTDGNDSNNGLANTAAGAFKTIGKAISSIPSVVNHAVYINIASGTYAETLNMGGFSGAGKIYINNGISALSTSYNIQSLRIINCGVVVSISGLNAQTTTTNAFMVENCLTVEFYYCQATAATVTYHGFVAHSSKVYTYACRASNRYVGFYAGQNSNFLVWSTDGTANKVALMGAEGGLLSYNGTYPTASTLKDIAYQNSGSVTSGVLNPWGDNTTGNRSAFRAWNQSTQTVSATTFTKLSFPNSNMDNLGNYNVSTSRFVAPQGGIYLIAGAVSFSGMPVGTYLTLSAFINGSRGVDLGSYTPNSNPGTMFTQGASAVYLAAGHYVELYTYVTSAGTTIATGFGELNHFTVTKIA